MKEYMSGLEFQLFQQFRGFLYGVGHRAFSSVFSRASSAGAGWR